MKSALCFAQLLLLLGTWNMYKMCSVCNAWLMLDPCTHASKGMRLLQSDERYFWTQSLRALYVRADHSSASLAALRHCDLRVSNLKGGLAVIEPVLEDHTVPKPLQAAACTPITLTTCHLAAQVVPS